VIRRLVETVTSLMTWLKRDQMVELSTTPAKVNLGSSLHVADGWVNVDGSLSALFSKWPAFFLRGLYRLASIRRFYSEESYVSILKHHVFVHHQLLYGLPFRDETVDYVYSSHLLEHLSRRAALELLREAHRALKTGGTIRICVPDLEYVFGLYRAGRKEKALSYFFADEGDSDLGRHRYMYDYEMLSGSLESVGFVDTVRCSHRQGNTPDLDVLDNRPEETLFVEARKAPQC